MLPLLPQDWLVHPLWLTLAMALVHFVWQGTLLATLYAFLVRYLVRSAEQRYLLGIAAMLAMVMCVPVTMAIVEPPALTAAQADSYTGPAAAMSAVALDAAAVDVAQPDSVPEVSTLSALGVWLPWVAAVWLIGVCALSLRLVTGIVALRWLAARGNPPDFELMESFNRLGRTMRVRRLPRLIVARHVRTALAVGFFRPVILLPAAWLSELPPNVVEAVLAHELAHIRRYDLWINLLQRVVEALLFFHPAVWWISKQIRADREMCCDELALGVVGGGEQRLAYASALEVVALRTVREPEFSLATGMGGRKMQLLNRVRNVLGLPPTSPAGAWWPAGVLALVAPCVVWLMTAQRPQVAQADDEEVVVEVTSELDDARENDEGGKNWLKSLPLLGRLFSKDEEIVTEVVRSDDGFGEFEIEVDEEVEAPKKKIKSDLEFEIKVNRDKAEAQRERAEAEVARAKKEILKLTADEDEEYAHVAKRLAEAKQKLVEELDRAHKLDDTKAAAEAELRVEKLRRSLEQQAADMKLKFAARREAQLEKLKAEGYAPRGDDVHDFARQMHERIAEVHKETDAQRRKIHQGIAEAAKNQQHDVVRNLHEQMEKLNADSTAAQHKLHMALGEKIKAQHSSRVSDYERQFAEHQNRFAAEREKLEAHRQMLDAQRADLEQQQRKLIDRINELRESAKLAANPKVEAELKLANPKVELELQHKIEKLANPKKIELEFSNDLKLAPPRKVELEFQSKLDAPKKSSVDDSNRQELLDIVRELRKELQDLRREVRELRGDRGDKKESRWELIWPEGAPKPKLPEELEARKRKLAGVESDREAIEIEIKAAKKAATDAAVAGEKAAKYAATAAEHFAKEASAAAEKVAKEAAVAAEQVAKQAAVAAEEAVKDAAATAEKAAKEAAEALEKAAAENQSGKAEKP
jgi:beta-lactamase regulating signal transducer with metallopeptidase domain